MGREMMLHSAPFRQSLEKSEQALASLQDKPSWSLIDEIAAGPSLSRISEGQISQPVCTAIQIALVDLLTVCGVRLDAVVGHSSGEIGAAYAVGIIDARDAMGIAYYRGLVVAAAKAQGISGDGRVAGGMMATGMSYDDAKSLCSNSRFRDRITVAASNSPSSVTLSGDLDVIHEAKQLLDEKQTFARVLRVDTAYHSHHMLRCEEQYLAYLRQLNVQVKAPRPDCTWFSSVYPRAINSHSDDQLAQLKDQYWVENMKQAVLFSQAAELAFDTAGPFALALEIGPHPALKGPVNQIQQSLAGAPGVESSDASRMPYAGCLERGAQDVKVMSDALGLIWGYLGPSRVDLGAWHSNLGEKSQDQHRGMLKGLPTYSWQHDQVYWHESRLSHNYRLGQHAPHELLGRLRDKCQQEMIWRSILRLEEIPWLRGHMFQGQAVFPGAGYVSMAVQAAKVFVQERGCDARLVEIRDMQIIKAMVIEESTPGVEVLFTVKEERQRSGVDAAGDDEPQNGSDELGTIVEAGFTVYACSDQRTMSKCSEGRILIHLSESASLPPSTPLLTDSSLDLPSLDVGKFMSAVGDLGIAYEGPFRALKSIGRAHGHARAMASWNHGELGDEYILHPAVLDVAFQVGFASFLSTAENAMGTTYLPAGVRSVVVNLAQLEAGGVEKVTADKQDEMCVTSHLVGTGDGPTIEVDLDVCGPRNMSTASRSVQIEGLRFQAVGEPLASDDRLLFAKTAWDVDVAHGMTVPEPRPIEQDEVEYIDAVERTALFFLRTLREQTLLEEIKHFKPHHQALFRAIDHLLAPVREGRHAVARREWLQDTRQVIDEFAKRYHGSVDLALLTAVGENLPTAVRGQSEILEAMLKDNLLGRLYTEGRGFATCNEYVGDLMRQISYKYPRTRILEMGAGTGGTTARVLEAIGDAYVSYTYTDISAGFFERAAERFVAAADKMEFRTLNAEYPPSEQGFQEGSYDIIIAANVLHATRRLSETMRNVRSLLRPGGYLLAVEVTGNMLREPGLMGGLEGWWLGEEDGRFPSPGISAQRWDEVLRETGFSGVDAIAYDTSDVARHNCSSFVTQAMDDRLEVLRDPLASLDLIPIGSGPVLIFGGHTSTLPVIKCIQRAQKLLRRWTSNIHVVSDLDHLNLGKIDTTGAHVLYLAELDDNAAILSRALTKQRLEGLQELLASAKNVLWVTGGRRADNPHASMAVGIGRALAFELPHVRMQFVDFEKGTSWDPTTMVQHLLRLVFLSSLHQQDESSQMLWSHEREIVVTQEATLVSRVLMDDEANARFNARRRRVEKRVGPHEHLEITYNKEPGRAPPRIVLATKSESTRAEGHKVNVVDVALSTSIIIDENASCFLAFGECRASRAPAIVLSGSDVSVAHVSDHDLLELAKDVPMDAQHLRRVASAVLGQLCASLMPEHGTILVFAPYEGVDEAIQIEAKRLGRKVIFVSSSSDRRHVEGQPGWLFIHPLERARTIRAMLPEDAGALLYFSRDGSPLKKILEALPNNCAIQLVSAPDASNHRQDHLLAVAFATAPSLICHAPEIDSLERIGQHQKQKSASIPTQGRVVDWRQRDCLDVTVLPLRTQGFFAPDKTYLLVGMTGELGKSLCQFMIDCGARHIVLASRSPPVGYEKWFRAIRHDKTAGAKLQVKMIQMDVTSQEQVHTVISTIRKTMPEIAGVANAALVLQDALFVNATVDAIEKQLGPKVDGTSYLDEEFSGCNLDFFLCFSSLASVFGNAGQSIYHAANMFTTSLVERRRRRGQAGSVVHVGMIVDAGYVARSTRSGANIEEHLRSQSYMPLAEKEFHHLILEGVLVGKPQGHSSEGRCSNGEVTVGVQRFVDDPEAPTRPQWYHDPRMSHMILPMSSSSSQQTAAPGQGTKKELLSMLENAVSVSEVTDIYQKLFCMKMESMMKIPAASIDTTAPLADLGLDSLLAVEIRAWLLKDMRLDVPLLGILSRESVSSICAVGAQQHVFEQQSKATADSRASEESALDPTAPTSSSGNITGTAETDSSDENTSAPNLSQTPSPTTTDFRNVGISSPPSLSSGMTPSEPDQYDIVVDTRKHIGTDADERAVLTAADPIPAISHSLSAQSYGGNSAPGPVLLERDERMSYSQASMHFLHNFLEDATTFNVVAQYQVRGSLNVARFQRALEKVMARHDAYRTQFSADAGGLEPRQRIAFSTGTAGSSMSRFEHVSVASPAQARSVFRDLSQREWQLARGEAFQCVLVSHESDTTLFFGCHHIIMDGMSWHIFLTDLDRAYRLLPLEPVSFTYADFSRQQLEDLERGQMDESIAFWIRKLDPVPGVMPLLPLSHRRRRKMSREYRNHTVQKELAPQTHQQIKQAAQSYRATPMQLYLVALQILLMHLVDDLDGDELCIGVTDAGRGASGHFAETVGHFTNLLPMKFPMRKGMSVTEVVSETSQIVGDSYEHAHVPLDLILEKLQIQRSMANTPLFQVAFNYRIGDLLNRALGTCQLDLVAYRDARTPYDVMLSVTQSSTGSPLVEITSNAYLYTKEATQRLLEIYADLLDTLSSAGPSTKLHELSLRPLDAAAPAAPQDAPGGQPRGPSTAGDGSERFPKWPKTLTERLQQVWNDYPDTLAIQDDVTSLTYKGLRGRIQKVASALRGRGICPGMHVAVLCHPGIDSHTTMLAVLWLGAVYVPLDVTLPAKRLDAMMNACKPTLLVFHEPTRGAVDALLLSAASGEEAQQCATAAVSTLNLADLAYSESPDDERVTAASSSVDDAQEYSFILFTSGSTGTPKGIKLSQAGIMNYAASKSAFLGLAPGLRVLQQSSPGFDMSIAQAFNAFANAGTLVVAPLRARGDPTMLAQLMASQAVELTIATPTEYLMLAQYASDLVRGATSWRFACSGGETVTQGLIDALQRLELPQLRLTDCYGPTETSCAATFRSISLDGEESSSVGHPLPNTNVYIVGHGDGGQEQQPLPSGQPGEICIGGCGVARGYLDDTLSQGKFVQNAFATKQDVERGWTTMYKTGDKGCLLPDGALVFLGRMDLDLELVKLRGLRIELGEVSRAIVEASRGAVTDAVVTVRGTPEFLVAHVVLASANGGTSPVEEQQQQNQTLFLASLVSDLALHVPRYMVPSFIVPLDRIPMTPHGKVDRRAIAGLPLPQQAPVSSKQDDLSTDAPQPLTVAQGELRLLWREVLGGAAVIRADTDFFTVGGSSLLLVRLQSLLQERMGIKIPLHELYEVSTLGRMAARAGHERSQVVPDEEAIDWDRETAIPLEIQQLLSPATSSQPSSTPTLSSSSSSHLGPRHRILLTGAGGFIGSEILRALIADQDVAEIHCIAVPVDKQQAILSLSPEKITVYVGSLLSSTLGLSTTEQQRLQANVDCIIHAGAQGHCLNNYRSVRQANYLSTQFLVALALPNSIPFHLISSPRVILQRSVAGGSGGDGSDVSCINNGPSRSMAQHPPGADGSQGFTASKWASERFLERVVQQQQDEGQNRYRGGRLPVVIHRACSLIGDRAPHDDAMNSVLRYSVLSGTVPDLPNARGFFDFKDVVDVARDIASAAMASASGSSASSSSAGNGGDGGGDVVFCHHSSNVRVPFHELGRRLEELHGGKFTTVAMSEWLRGAVELGIEELIVSYLEANVAGGGTLLFPYLGE